MEVMVVGSVALDTIETPETKVEDVLGWSASYFCYACSFFSPVRLVAVVGPDFDRKHIEMLQERGVDTAGLVVTEGRTLRWHGRYFGSGDKRAAGNVRRDARRRQLARRYRLGFRCGRITHRCGEGHARPSSACA